MRITVTGDLSITGAFIEKVNTDTEIFSETILNSFEEQDYVITNLEGPTTHHKKFTNHNTPLKSPVNTIAYLKKRNIKVYNLANNHILDYGSIGLQDTLQHIKQHSCQSFGAGLHKNQAIKPIILTKNGISIGLIAINKTTPSIIDNAQVFSSDEFKELKSQIKKLKKNVDFVIVNFHGGEEYTLFPSPVKRRFLKKIAKLKEVAMVIAHHSHTFQGYEFVKKTPILYSLGNFVFDIPNHKTHAYTDKSALLNIEFTKQNFTFTFLPFTIKNGAVYCRNQEEFISELKNLNNFKNYKSKWQAEAYRTLFRKENKNYDASTETNTLQQKSLLKLLLSSEFYHKFYTVLKNKYMFSLYVGAVIYKLKKKLIK